MKPLMIFGPNQEFGLSLNRDGAIVFHQNASGESDPIYPEMLEEIHRHGGYEATRAMLYGLAAVAPMEVKQDVPEEPAEKAEEEAKPPKAKTRGRKKAGK